MVVRVAPRPRKLTRDGGPARMDSRAGDSSRAFANCDFDSAGGASFPSRTEMSHELFRRG